MRFERLFTRGTPDPYEGVPFTRIVAASGLEMVVPASWQGPAADFLTEEVLGQVPVPASRIAVSQAGVPEWLCPRAAENRLVPEIYETDVRQVIDRIGGFWAWRAWRAGVLGADEENARVFYDEIRHVLLHRLATPTLAEWKKAGFAWAYGVGLADPDHAPPAVETFAGSDAPALSLIGAHVRALFDARALASGRKQLLDHLDAVMAAYGTPRFQETVAQARDAGVAGGLLSDAVLYARQGFSGYPLPDAPDTVPVDLPRRRLVASDGFMASGSPLLEEMAGAIWSAGGLELCFAGPRDPFLTQGGVFTPRVTVNLAPFWPRRADAPFCFDAFTQTVRLLVTALDARASDAPGRPLEIGLSGIEPELAARGLSRRSPKALSLHAAFCALLTGEALVASSDLAAGQGSCPAVAGDREGMRALIRRQRAWVKGIGGDAVKDIPVFRAEHCPDLGLVRRVEQVWDSAVVRVEAQGLRHAALTGLWRDAELEGFLGHHPGTALLDPDGDLEILAACQPGLAGTAHGVVTLPRDAGVADVRRLIVAAWKTGLQSVLFYREGSALECPFEVIELEEAERAPRTPQHPRELVVLSEPPAVKLAPAPRKRKTSDG